MRRSLLVWVWFAGSVTIGAGMTMLCVGVDAYLTMRQVPEWMSSAVFLAGVVSGAAALVVYSFWMWQVGRKREAV